MFISNYACTEAPGVRVIDGWDLGQAVDHYGPSRSDSMLDFEDEKRGGGTRYIFAACTSL